MNPIEGGPAQENVALGYYKKETQNVAVIKQMWLSVLLLSAREGESR